MEHKWKRRQRRQRKIRIILLVTLTLCVIFGTTIAQSAAKEREAEARAEAIAKAAEPSEETKTPEVTEAPVETEVPEVTEPPAETVPSVNPKNFKWAKGLTGWQKHKDVWYYLDGEGMPATGWLQTGGHWYYLNADGSMAIGWILDKDVWYYLNEEGAMMTGWIHLNEGWYYLRSDGSMATGWICDEKGRNYYLQDNGLWLEGVPPVYTGSTDNSSGPMVALTFDDGPGQYTDRLLNSLEQYNARATFFMLGELVPQYPAVVQRMDALGCEIGNHSYNHAKLTSLKPEGVQIQMGQTNQNLIDIIGRGASVGRPPYAAMNEMVLSNLGLPAIIWDIDTLDWQTLNVQATIDSVLNNVKDGDIVLMHDIHATSVAAAEYIIPALIERGYQLVTVTELAASRGITLEAGKTYSSF